jgi:HSP20 family molecular chaperone IbpA
MTLPKLTSIWKKWTRSPRRLWMGGGIAAVLATLAVVGLADASDGRTTSRLGGISVEQDQKSYVVTIPDAQDARARLNGDTLQVRTQDRKSGLQSEQNLILPEADPAAQPQVSRQNGNLVVTVPKRTSQTLTVGPSLALTAGFEQDLFARMEAMQRRMDALFEGFFGDEGFFGAMPRLGSLPALGTRRTNPGVQWDLQDKGGSYVVRAENLNPEKQNINVAVDNDRVLKITAQQEDSAANSRSFSKFTQAFTLPGPVKSSQMKIDHQDGALVITLPKA